MTLPEPTLPFSALEEWRVIKDYPNYEISSFGRVRRLTNRTCAKAGTILKTPIRSKYPCVDLCRDGGKRTFHVHVLVAGAFLPEIAGMELVNHVSGVKTNCRLDNLERSTYQRNSLHSYRIGLSNASGENNGMAKMTWAKAEEVRRLASMENRPSYTAIGKIFGVNEGTIRHIVHGHTWVKPVHGDVPRVRGQKPPNKNNKIRDYAKATQSLTWRNALGKTSHSLLAQKLDYYGWKCRYCGVRLTKEILTFDHAIPAGKGGTNWTANLMPCCQKCNCKKRGKTFLEYMSKINSRLTLGETALTL